MKPGSILLAALTELAAATQSAAAEENVKVGIIVTLSGPPAVLGGQVRDGFKRDFKGEIVDEVYTPLGQLDFSAELAKIAADKPEAVFTFMPGGMDNMKLKGDTGHRKSAKERAEERKKKKKRK